MAGLLLALLVVGTLALNLHVDHLWRNFPQQSGPCLSNQEAACQYGFVN